MSSNWISFSLDSQCKSTFRWSPSLERKRYKRKETHAPVGVYFLNLFLGLCLNFLWKGICLAKTTPTVPRAVVKCDVIHGHIFIWYRFKKQIPVDVSEEQGLQLIRQSINKANMMTANRVVGVFHLSVACF